MNPVSWHWDTGVAAVIVSAGVAYGWAWRRADTTARRYVWWFVICVALTAADRVLASRAARLAAHPATTSAAMLATPWLLYLTPWYTAALRHQAVAAATNVLGPLIAGPRPRVDQSIGAGVLWLLGDVLGAAFIVVLMRFLSADERSRAAAVDAELDRAYHDEAQPVSGLWWENDPQLRERMRRA
jgi:cytochrome c oxidase assembly factor CtaG